MTKQFIRPCPNCDTTEGIELTEIGVGNDSSNSKYVIIAGCFLCGMRAKGIDHHEELADEKAYDAWNELVDQISGWEILEEVRTVQKEFYAHRGMQNVHEYYVKAIKIEKEADRLLEEHKKPLPEQQNFF